MGKAAVGIALTVAERHELVSLSRAEDRAGVGATCADRAGRGGGAGEQGDQTSKLAEAIRYALSRWAGLSRFLDDGRVEIDNNTVERAIRPLALTRKNALFAGSDGGAGHWAVVASLSRPAS